MKKHRAADTATDAVEAMIGAEAACLQSADGAVRAAALFVRSIFVATRG